MAISGVFVLPDDSRFSWTSQYRHGNCRKINIRAANTDYSPPLVYIIDNTDSGSHLGGACQLHLSVAMKGSLAMPSSPAQFDGAPWNRC